ncbi:MAG: CHAT domain-containing tetratricopeptide repeat protein [Phaeodactylibacter sp.]|uniref:CHAT domain-containing protein n=1 Tax=Phaeodactylibacter sp. TaxID=1940289 RepID=UPI0032ED9AF8
MKLWRLSLLIAVWCGGATPFDLIGQETPEVLVCEGDALRQANAYTAAFGAYERAYPYYVADSNYYMMAYLKTWSSEMAYEEWGDGYYKKGNAAVQEAYRIAQAHLLTDTLSFYPITLMNMGIYYGTVRDYEQKLTFYQKGKKAAQRVQGQYGTYTSIAYNNLGFTYGSRRNWKKSLNYLDTALVIARETGNQTAIFSAQNNKAHAYAEMGDFERAIFTQEAALEAASEAKDYARAANNLGVLYAEIKEWDAGIRYLKEALEIRRQLSETLTENIFSTQLNLVWAYSSSDQTEKSDALLDEVIKEAVALSPAFDNSLNLQIAYNYRARNALKSDRLGEAMSWVRKAEQVGSWSLEVWASTKLVKSMVLDAGNRTEEALWAVQESYQILVPGYQPKAVTDLPDWRAMEAIAYTLTLFQLQAALLEKLAKERQEPDLQQAALNTLEAADSAVTVSRLSYQSQMSKELMSANAKNLYNALIAIHYRLYQNTGKKVHHEQAFLYMEKNKALSVLENLNAMEAARFHDIPGGLVEAERGLREDIAFYQLNLNAGRPGEYPEQEKIWKAELSRLTQSQDSLFRIIKQQFPRYYKTRIGMEMPDLKTVQQTVIGPEETMIEYFQSDDALYVLMASTTTTQFIRLDTDRLERNVKELYEALRNKDPEVSRVSHRVYQQVFEPLRKYIEGEKLVLIPDGPLSYIPFDQFVMEEAEGNRRKYLMEEYSIRRLLSGSTALQYEDIQEEAGIRHGIMALAPLFTSGQGSVRAADQFGPLPGAQKEVDALDGLFQGTFLRGPDATEEAFKDNCAASGILHLATHTAINDQFPNATHLLLKETEKEDGKLNVYEIYGQSIPAQLGFLSGCNTGIGTLKAGEGAISLGHAFAYAGCPNIVMTLWPIKDDLVPELVKVYYNGLRNGLDKAEALREAKLFSLKNDELFAHPYYWSGFVYTGDRSPVQLYSFVLTDYIWVIAGAVFAILIGAVVWWKMRS